SARRFAYGTPVSSHSSPDKWLPFSFSILSLEYTTMQRSIRRPFKSYRTPLSVEMLEDRLAPSVVLGQQPGAPNTTQFHGDSARTGFNQNETFLTPANVASSFGQVWQSPVLDGHLYASPLYQDNITIRGEGNAAHHAGDGIQSALFQDKTLGVVFAATGG